MAATNPPIFWGIMTQSEATAAQRTRTFAALDATDGITPELTVTYSGAEVQVSKNGGAFGDASGVVTEIAVGVYKFVAAAADLDTIGEAVFKFADAAARVVLATVQVVAADVNVALAGAAELAAVQADVDTVQLQTVPMRVTGPHTMGTRTTNGSFNPFGAMHAAAADVNLAGTWNGATVTVEVCQDVNAVSPIWSTYDDGAGPNPLTANGTVRVTGPYSGIRATLSSAGGSTSLAAAVTFYSPAT